MPNSTYLKQAELLLRLLPLILREEVFALKGGTAINFFWRDLPRISVDIDLAYIKIQERDLSLIDISDRFAAVEARIQRVIPNIRITQQTDHERIVGLRINTHDAFVKVEVNTVIRGTVFPVIKKKLCSKAEETFELTLSTNTLSLEDLYGGKICAALERQHPRDLFDVKLLLENEGITNRIRKSFIVYLISHSRPIVEVLNPGLQDIKKLFENEFAGMTLTEVKLDTLIDVRTELIKKIKTSLTEDEIKFILSFKNRNPEWERLGIDGIKDLPSVQWKMINLKEMNTDKHTQAYEKLKRYFE
jgi:predicted nucleotidyltransferase component of viral defense system